jgi:hypothetical protein
MEETRSQIERMIELDLIEPSKSPCYSHVHLVRKPTGKWRYCIDSRGNIGWPIPNIVQTLERIGSKKSKVFAKFDMTSGYFQMAFDPSIRDATSFIYPVGVYRWKRIPMRWKSAGAHFQQQLAGFLNGLLYHKCELCMDDILPFAESKEEMLQRLHRLFTRFREYNVTLNPEKCAIGMTRVEYVGHLIDSEGIHFTRTMLDSIGRFEEPKTMFEVIHFLGLANYFRDHVPNFSVITIPLQKLVIGYTKSMRTRKVKLEGSALDAFIELREAMDRSQKLFYFDIEVNPSEDGCLRLSYRRIPIHFAEGGGDTHPLLKPFFSESTA